jgi:hypothetical protein
VVGGLFSENSCRQLGRYFPHVFDYSRARKTPTTMEMDTKAYSDTSEPKSARPVRNLIAIVLAVFFFPRRVGNAVSWLMDRTLFRFLERKKDEKDSE